MVDVIENMTAVSEFFPMELQDDAVVLQFSSALLNSKQKVFSSCEQGELRNLY